MKRSITASLLKDLKKKIILITGPRQVGKTTLSKSLISDYSYFNYDNPLDRKKISSNKISFNDGPLIFDEIHKMKNWKRWLKGFYDTRQEVYPIVVTGSAKVDTYKKMGDSLAGRYLQYRLLPLDVKEIVQFTEFKPQKALDQLMLLSGFPEPFLGQNETEYLRWRKTHQDIIVRQDLIETDTVKSISSIEFLIELMTEKIGSTLSYNSLREDLQTDDKSVKRWLLALENSYVLFKITPYSTKIKNSLTKAPKYYFYDLPRVPSLGARFENLIALALYKEILYRQDVLGEDYSLHYLRNKNQAEVDFVICKKKKPIMMIESKLSDNSLKTSFESFEKYFEVVPKVVLVKNLDRTYTMPNGIKVVPAADWLSQLNF